MRMGSDPLPIQGVGTSSGATEEVANVAAFTCLQTARDAVPPGPLAEHTRPHTKPPNRPPNSTISTDDRMRPIIIIRRHSGLPQPSPNATRNHTLPITLPISLARSRPQFDKPTNAIYLCQCHRLAAGRGSTWEQWPERHAELGHEFRI
jgi:hypothetical protein